MATFIGNQFDKVQFCLVGQDVKFKCVILQHLLKTSTIHSDMPQQELVSSGCKFGKINGETSLEALQQNLSNNSTSVSLHSTFQYTCLPFLSHPGKDEGL